MSDEKIYPIELCDIEISEFNVRHGNPTTDLNELAASIRKLGLLHLSLIHI